MNTLNIFLYDFLLHSLALLISYVRSILHVFSGPGFGLGLRWNFAFLRQGALEEHYFECVSLTTVMSCSALVGSFDMPWSFSFGSLFACMLPCLGHGWIAPVCVLCCGSVFLDVRFGYETWKKEVCLRTGHCFLASGVEERRLR